MKGRKSKPVEQRKREGNPGKRKLAAPLKLRPGTPVKPTYLLPSAGKLWDELVSALAPSGLAGKVDASALTALCVQWARAEQAREVLDEYGLFGKGSTGQIIEHPALSIERNAHAMFLRFAEQYGLTAAARARIAGAVDPVAGAEEDELADVLTLVPRRVS